MPKCEYCGTYPYATYCDSFHRHVNSCKLAAEKAIKAAEKAKEEKLVARKKIDEEIEARVAQELKKRRLAEPLTPAPPPKPPKKKIIVNNYITNNVTNTVNNVTNLDVKIINNTIDMGNGLQFPIEYEAINTIGKLRNAIDGAIDLIPGLRKCLENNDPAAKKYLTTMMAALRRFVADKDLNLAKFLTDKITIIDQPRLLEDWKLLISWKPQLTPDLKSWNMIAKYWLMIIFCW